MGIQETGGVVVLPFPINPVTGRLQVTVYPLTYTANSLNTDDARRDNNRTPSMIASRDDNDEPMPVHVHGGRILIDLP